ncbi:MAG: polysaccharide biosynthesis tyrosine autokinase, partial [Candidatus Electryoneaceae bacterium]|nr:polysaccharide biosynthesis tyrosine autokinase [Candidatus Electryoneaceae bacterium]
QRKVGFQTFFFAVLKRPWIIIVCLVLILGPLGWYLKNTVPTYRSSSVVMASVKRGSNFADVMSIVGGAQSNTKESKYYTSILESASYYESVVEQIIATYPDMPPDSLARIIYSGNNLDFNYDRRNEGFLEIYALSESPKFALALATSSLEQFRKRCVNLERAEALRISSFIDDQITHISSSLEQAEASLHRFLSGRGLLLTDAEGGVGQELLELEQDLSTAEAQVEMVEINVESYRRQMNDLLTRLEQESASGTSDEIIDLKSQIEEIRQTLQNHADNLSEADIQRLRNRRDQLRGEIVRSISASAGNSSSSMEVSLTLQQLEEAIELALFELTNFQNQARFYQIQIDRFKTNHPNLSEDILEYIRQSRSKEVLRKTLDILLEKREEARIRVASEQGGIRVIDSPRLPSRPLGEGKMRKFLFGIILALGLGIGISVLIEILDQTIIGEKDIQHFNIPVFGTIPVVVPDKKFFSGVFPIRSAKRKRHGKHSEEEISGKMLSDFSEKSPIAEAYRSLKLSLLFLAEDQQKQVFVISSPSASEGKSLTVANLAISLAQGDKKTLIVDTDLRKSIIHKYFRIDRKPGLTDHLLKNVPLEEIIKPSQVKNLSLITAGTSPPNPAELIASQKMTDFVTKLRSMFDIILFDTPPILICADSRLMAEKTDGIVILTKVESTNLRAFEHSLDMLQLLKNIDVLGAILNQAEYRFGQPYYYVHRYYNPYSYGYYYHGYEYYYSDDKETGERIKKRKKKRVAKST